jgi:hypothetical protein
MGDDGDSSTAVEDPMGGKRKKGDSLDAESTAAAMADLGQQAPVQKKKTRRGNKKHHNRTPGHMRTKSATAKGKQPQSEV